MGRRYYCDYCNRSFPDSAENRKKHLNGLQHQRLRKAHYDAFRDAAAILDEEIGKKPCRKFHRTGECEFGSSCKYSHLKPEDVQALQEQAKQDEFNKSLKLNHSIPSQPEVSEWIQKWAKRQRKKPTNIEIPETAPSIPKVLSSFPNIPPSLLPAKNQDFLYGPVAEWEAS